MLHTNTKSWAKFELPLLLLLCLAVRIIFIVLKPPNAVALDMHYWEEVLHQLNLGQNPYISTTRLNWPPLWLGILSVLGSVQAISALPLQLLVQIFLIALELILLTLLYRSLTDLGSYKPFRLLLWAVALNPICILLNVQHLNFDVLVALCIALCIHKLLLWNERQQAKDWLWACVFLGLGILAKSIPIALLPLLFIRFDALSKRIRISGLSLALLPTFLAVLVLYWLAPQDTLSKVIQYRSAGWGLLPEILRYFKINVSQSYWSSQFFIIILSLLSLSSVYCRKAQIGNLQLLSLAFILLASILCLGPGFGNQYLWWLLPPLTMLYALEDRSWRRVALLLYCSTLFSFSFDYLLTSEHGALLSQIWPAAAERWLHNLKPYAALIRAPLFLALFALSILSAKRL